MTKVRRTRDDWKRIIEGQNGTGLTDKEWATQNGLTVSSIHNWRSKLKNDNRPAPKAVPEKLVELMVATGKSSLVVRLANGISLEVPQGWSIEQVIAIAQRIKSL